MSEEITHYVDIDLLNELGEFKARLRVKIPPDEVSKIYDAKGVTFRIQRRKEFVEEVTITNKDMRSDVVYHPSEQSTQR